MHRILSSSSGASAQAINSLGLANIRVIAFFLSLDDYIYKFLNEKKRERFRVRGASCGASSIRNGAWIDLSTG